jgi:hypothetical protein
MEPASRGVLNSGEIMAYIIGGAILFEDVPITGGREMLAALGVVGIGITPLQARGFHIGHARRSEITDRRYSIPDRSFGIIRHPVDWYCELWKWIESSSCGLFDHGDSIRHPFEPIMRWARRGLSCGEFVGELVHRAGGFYSSILADYLDGAALVGRIDNIGPAAVAACKLAGIELGPAGMSTLAAFKAPRTVGGKIEGLTAEVIRDVESIEGGAVVRFERSGVYTEGGELVPRLAPKLRKRRKGRR